KIQTPTLDWRMMDKGILHIQLYGFNNNSERLFYNAVSDGMNRGMKGVILDLRNDPGGFFDVAVNLAGWFLKRDEVIVKQKSADGQIQLFRARGNELLQDTPVVILINGGSASASEILAGALKVNRGIKLVGEKSFGKGTVQDIESLSDGSTLKITIAHWLLPDGKLIDKNGLKPDYEIKLTEEDIKADRDPQLDKAVEVITPLLK
ncbi:MAG: peptidase S41, partial [Candidatus Colwellbacteria bacterium]|nr:peptidase S41 [Candidatus Colwellbacteria bacterium]